MSELEVLEKLEILIEFFKDFNAWLDAHLDNVKG